MLSCHLHLQRSCCTDRSRFGGECEDSCRILKVNKRGRRSYVGRSSYMLGPHAFSFREKTKDTLYTRAAARIPERLSPRGRPPSAQGESYEQRDGYTRKRICLGSRYDVHAGNPATALRRRAHQGSKPNGVLNSLYDQ